MSTADAPHSAGARRLPMLAPCALEGIREPLLCGTLERPENPDRPDGRRIGLRVVVVPARSAQPRSDPWVEMTGGPGNAATDYARFYADSGAYAPFRRDRDVLLVDARGMGGSHPLFCAELDRFRWSPLFRRWPPDAVRQCRDRLRDSADLAQYSTAHTADDLEAVRRWLGYGQLNLWGYSYGTRAALTYAQRHPTRVRSMVLWGVVPLDFRRPLWYARDGQRALDRLLADCDADTACARAFPTRHEDVRQVLARLAAAPVPISGRAPLNGDGSTLMLTAAGVADGIWSVLSVPEQARRLPLAMHHAARGDYGALRDLLVSTTPPRRRYFNAAHLSIVCPEEVQFVTAAAIDSAYRGTFMPTDRAHDYLEACRIWGLPALSISALSPVRVDAPTLVVSGAMDPITPPTFGEQVARTLPRSRHLVSPVLSHESDGIIGAECLDSLSMQFLDRPDPGRLDVACFTRLRAPPFELGRTPPPR